VIAGSGPQSDGPWQHHQHRKCPVTRANHGLPSRQK